MTNASLSGLEPSVASTRARAGRARGTTFGWRRPAKYGAMSLVALAVVLAGVLWERAPKPAAFRFDTAQVDRGPLRAKVTANGAVSALVTVNVGSQVSGRVQTLLADFGSRVKQGEVVATIDPSLFRAAADQATANLRAALASVARGEAQVVNAEKQFARTAALHEEGLSTSSELETAEANLAVARADLNVARANVNQATAARAQAELNLKYTTII